MALGALAALLSWSDVAHRPSLGPLALEADPARLLLDGPARALAYNSGVVVALWVPGG